MKHIWIISFVVICLILTGLYLSPFNKTSEKPKNANLNKILPLKEKVHAIVAAGDISCGESDTTAVTCAQGRTVEIIKKINPEAILALGDLQYPSGAYNDFLNFYDKSWGQFKEKTYPTPGNHEYSTPQASGYFNYFNKEATESGRAGKITEGYYSFNIGKNWHIISLNSNCWAVGGCGINSPQLNFLKKDLAENKDRSCTIAFWHHPLLTSGFYSPGYEPVKPFWGVLYENNVELVLNGHDHIYERFGKMDPGGIKSEGGVRQFIVGTGGRNLYAIKNILNGSEARQNQEFGVLKLTLLPESYEWEFVSVLDAGYTDKGTDNCH